MVFQTSPTFSFWKESKKGAAFGPREKQWRFALNLQEYVSKYGDPKNGRVLFVAPETKKRVASMRPFPPGSARGLPGNVDLAKRVPPGGGGSGGVGQTGFETFGPG